jgi:NAD(P)-dependent dehydrogenase (short-subunit alcohol dehydrogenase family)
MPGELIPSPNFAGKLGSRYAHWSPDFDLSAVLETAKAAISNLTKTLAIKWSAKGINTNAIASGPARTLGRLP